MRGTPWEVPDPKKINENAMRRPKVMNVVRSGKARNRQSGLIKRVLPDPISLGEFERPRGRARRHNAAIIPFVPTDRVEQKFIFARTTIMQRFTADNVSGRVFQES